MRQFSSPPPGPDPTIDFTPGGGPCPKCGAGSSWDGPEAELRYLAASHLADGSLIIGEALGSRDKVFRLACTCRTCEYQWLMRTADDPENGSAK